MTDREASTGTVARCATPATAGRGGGSGEFHTIGCRDCGCPVSPRATHCRRCNGRRKIEIAQAWRVSRQPSESAILDALRGVEWRTVADLLDSLGIASNSSLCVQIHHLRKRGYRIDTRRKKRGQTAAYGLRGEP